jgi:tetratricopeptide (TPR) repeat protein
MYIPPKLQTRVGSHLYTLLIVVCLLTWNGAFALGWVPTTKQYFLLPDYCKAKMSDYMRGPVAGKIGSTSAWRREAANAMVPESQIPRWKKRVGADFLHLHHYCYGLALMNDAEDPRKSRGESRRIYRRAVGEVDYTRSKSRPGAPLWEVMSISYARALGGAGEWSQSQEVFQELLAANPTNPDIWVEYARQLKGNGKVNDAVSLLEQGLEKTQNKGPLLYWLAVYQLDLGDLTRARETTIRAEAAGMKVESLKRRLGRREFPAE